MAAYMIVLCNIKDRETFIQEYAIPTAKLIAEHGGEYVVRAPGVETIEGDFGDGLSAVISKWPSKDTIKAFWASPAYEALKARRQPVSEATVMIVEEPA